MQKGLWKCHEPRVTTNQEVPTIKLICLTLVMCLNNGFWIYGYKYIFTQMRYKSQTFNSC